MLQQQMSNAPVLPVVYDKALFLDHISCLLWVSGSSTLPYGLHPRIQAEGGAPLGHAILTAKAKERKSGGNTHTQQLLKFPLRTGHMTMGRCCRILL